MDQLRLLMKESCQAAIVGLETTCTSLHERMKVTETFNTQQTSTNKSILDRLSALEKEATPSTASTYDSSERSRKHPRTEPSSTSLPSKNIFNDSNSPLTLRLKNFPYRYARGDIQEFSRATISPHLSTQLMKDVTILSGHAVSSTILKFSSEAAAENAFITLSQVELSFSESPDGAKFTLQVTKDTTRQSALSGKIFAQIYRTAQQILNPKCPSSFAPLSVSKPTSTLFLMDGRRFIPLLRITISENYLSAVLDSTACDHDPKPQWLTADLYLQLKTAVRALPIMQ